MYRLKVTFLKSRVGRSVYRRWMARRGRPVRTVKDYITANAPGRSFLDVGGMWNISGAHSFLAEDAGATRVVLLDIYRTQQFDDEKARRGSHVEFVKGDATNQRTLAGIGICDVLWCFGVLYHVPDPFALIRSLRTVCRGTLLLETVTIPEVPGLPQAALYFPMMPPPWIRHMWPGARIQHAVTSPYRPDVGYGNNFWGLSPTAVKALLETNGFRVDEFAPSPKGPGRHVFICSAQPWRDAFAETEMPYDPIRQEMDEGKLRRA